jgi:hypothetical protein
VAAGVDDVLLVAGAVGSRVCSLLAVGLCGSLVVGVLVACLGLDGRSYARGYGLDILVVEGSPTPTELRKEKGLHRSRNEIFCRNQKGASPSWR